jgi:diguanylate cyclase (GGDEF)-like protein
MTPPSCIVCGETVLVQTCPSCGAEVAIDHPHEDTRAAHGNGAATRASAPVALPPEEREAPRLQSGGARDVAAALRDRGAEVRDSLARRRDRVRETGTSAHEVLERAARDRERAAGDRERAADDRAQAAADRELAAAERREALVIRATSADLLERAATDDLTGARTRLFGLDEAAREIVDVDGLKHLNDTRGHGAGDALLRGVGEALRVNLRPYDVIVRYGGDEFMCVMPDVEPVEARARFARIALTLTAIDVEHSISFGLAQAWPGESLTTLIARADADLLRLRARATG